MLKIGVGVTGHSQALVADGVHSLSDLATDGLVIWAMKYGSQEADPEHPYGHERIQTLATVLLGGVLVIVGVGLGKEAIERTIGFAQSTIPSTLTLVVAAISIVTKEWIYRYTIRVARRLDSSLLEANAWHSRSDALSSVVVFGGIVGSRLGVGYLDSVAAIIVAAMIMKVGGRLIIEGVKELVDTGLAVADAATMRQVIAAVDGVEKVKKFRTRTMGSTIVADVNIQVSPDISVSEGHRIAEEVENRVVLSVGKNIDITVHVDSQYTHTGESVKLPMRTEVEKEIAASWSDISDVPYSQIVLHYREKMIDIDMIFSNDAQTVSSELTKALLELRKKMAKRQYIGEVVAFTQIK